MKRYLVSIFCSSSNMEEREWTAGTDQAKVYFKVDGRMET